MYRPFYIRRALEAGHADISKVPLKKYKRKDRPTQKFKLSGIVIGTKELGYKRVPLRFYYKKCSGEYISSIGLSFKASSGECNESPLWNLWVGSLTQAPKELKVTHKVQECKG